MPELSEIFDVHTAAIIAEMARVGNFCPSLLVGLIMSTANFCTGKHTQLHCYQGESAPFQVKLASPSPPEAPCWARRCRLFFSFSTLAAGSSPLAAAVPLHQQWPLSVLLYRIRGPMPVALWVFSMQVRAHLPAVVLAFSGGGKSFAYGALRKAIQMCEIIILEGVSDCAGVERDPADDNARLILAFKKKKEDIRGKQSRSEDDDGDGPTFQLLGLHCGAVTLEALHKLAMKSDGCVLWLQDELLCIFNTLNQYKVSCRATRFPMDHL